MGQKMTWQEIRQAYPKTFIVLKDYSEKRIQEDKVRILDGEVIFSSPDSREVYHQYNSHKDAEHVIFGYTGWEVFDVEERMFIGIRPAHA